jgi:hypothetical protein
MVRLLEDVLGIVLVLVTVALSTRRIYRGLQR